MILNKLRTMNKKVAVGMSGGVDSAIAAYLLKEQGYDVIGLHLKLHDGIDPLHQRACCSLDASLDARQMSHALDLPFYVINMKESFSEHVIQPFIREYVAGRTPNPCVACNKFIKFGTFLEKARQLGCDFLATGHYATVYAQEGRYRVRQSRALDKDQTYMLYTLTQEQLKHIIMPLGEVESKSTVREMAAKLGLRAATIQDSQDICFIPDDDHVRFLEHEGVSLKPGKFMLDGQVIGQHQGLPKYTIGQRKGLGLAYREPLFVKALDHAGNTVILGRGSELFSDQLHGKDLNLIYETLFPGDQRELEAKIRYSLKKYPCSLKVLEEGRFMVYFKENVRAITPGQSVVFYYGEDLYGGGIIER